MLLRAAVYCRGLAPLAIPSVQELTVKPIRLAGARFQNPRTKRALGVVHAQQQQRTMVAPTQHESQLLAAAKRFDDIFSSQTTDPITELTTPDVVLHADGITLGEDVKGQDALKNYLGSYFARYEFSHETIAGAVDSNDRIAFTFSVDKNVSPKGGGAAAAHNSQTACIFKHEFNSSNMITDIYFLRQLSADEAERKMRQAPDFSKLNVNYDQYKGSGMEADEQRAQRMQKAATAFNKIWATGDPSAADEIMTEDARTVDLLFVHETPGRENFKKMIKGVFQNWEVKTNKADTAVTAGNKAFISWQSTGIEKGAGDAQVTIYGMNMVVFNEEGKIEEVLGFRQPMASERQKYLHD